ncbi:oligopeptide transporter 4-like isoform X2 [Rhododendron vialii]|uniref:oligopeptide transporter 4-like isoform X2 n=1 Tax=Rhododendron vialii TaxID=182163 RepID=UPI00265F1A0F|nr:oligopeptide transporter 4-like isoform X2 [Rhododendron vialii]
MGTVEIEHPYPPTTITTATAAAANDGSKKTDDDDDVSPIEQVRLTVANTDDPTLPVWTFRMWLLGVLSCCLLSFLNQFFSYRTEPLIITQITVQIAALPIGRLLHAVLPETKFRIPGCGDRLFSLNPGPFNMKEHVLITIFANAGFAFGNGPAYAVGIVDIIKALYQRKISFMAGWILVITTQVLGYGWAGLLRKYVVEPAHMWWPSNLVQVSLFRVLHERDEKRMSRTKFFVVALICSFSWYAFPGYLFPTLTSISWVCWAFPKSVTAQQIGSGMKGLGVGAITLDWSAVSSFLFSPLISPFFSIVNIFIGYVLILYIAIPVSYWGLGLYGARKFPIFSSHLFTGQGQLYNISAIVNEKFEIDLVEYGKQGPIHLSMFFALTYGFGFATIAATLSHVSLFYGREIYERYCASYKGKDDIHTKLMRKYEDIPSWWFYVLLVVTIAVSLLLCTILKSQVQLPWWGLLFACLIAFVFTLPISIITATTNQFIGTIIAGTINMAVAWWLLNSIVDICQDELLPENSPWTCPGDRVFFDASVIWGLVGPKRIFGSLGIYSAMNWFFVFGAAGPIVVWLFHKTFPNQSWIPLVNLPVLLGATGNMPPATAVNYTSWIIVGTIFNFFIFRYRKKWWQRYNYVLSAALDAGVAFMAVLLYFSVGIENESVNWWGTLGEHCDLATCPTAKGIVVDGCPVY